MNATAPAPAPWTRAQQRLLVAGHVLAAGLVLGAWAGSAGNERLEDQLGWMNLAVIGLVVTGSVNAAWLLAGRRSIGRRRLRVAPDLVPAPPLSVTSSGWWRVSGLRRAHRAGCRLLQGRVAERIDAATIRAEGLLRCEVCR